MLMISRKNRFRGRNSLDHVYKKGRTVKSGPLSMRYLPSKREDYRLAVVVSKKVSKSAVTRNRIRRRIFELFRKKRAEYGTPINHDFIISVFDDKLADMPAEELSRMFEKLMSSAHIGP